jgi:hypothetical protein
VDGLVRDAVALGGAGAPGGAKQQPPADSAEY